MKIMGRQLRPLSRAWVDANSHVVSVVQENLDMLPAIKAFTREQHEQGRFDEANQQLLALSQRQLRIQSAALAGDQPAGRHRAGRPAVAGHDADRKRPAGAVADLVTLLLYAMLLMSPLGTLANVYGQVQRTRGSAERIIEFLGEQPEPADEGDIGCSSM